MSTDGVHCRECAGTGSVVLNVVPVTGAAYSGTTVNQFCSPLFFPHPLSVSNTVLSKIKAFGEITAAHDVVEKESGVGGKSPAIFFKSMTIQYKCYWYAFYCLIGLEIVCSTILYCHVPCTILYDTALHSSGIWRASPSGEAPCKVVPP